VYVDEALIVRRNTGQLTLAARLFESNALISSRETVVLRPCFIVGLALYCCFVGPLHGQTPPTNTIGAAGQSTTVQLPEFGIAIDAAGVIQLKLFEDPEGPLNKQRLAAAQAALPADLASKANLRVVSLPRLERAMAARFAEEKPAEEAMLHLAGLQRIEYVFCYPDTHELLVAGPAEGWRKDPAGRTVGITTGRPTVELEDLAVALRAFPAGLKSRTYIGCSIDPSAGGLAKLREFQQTMPASISTAERGQMLQYVAQGTRAALGNANVRTFGVPKESHFARVMVEADYRMKCIGIGLERPPVRLASFLELSKTGSHGRLERWWFTPNYQALRVSDDGLSLQLVGQGVQLQNEHKVIGSNGNLLNTAAPSKPSELFTAGFTEKYPQLAERSPVYAQLRLLIDLSIVAAYMQHKDLYGRAAWRPEILTDEDRFPVKNGPVMTEVPAVVNAIWRGNRLLAPAGGGVSIHPVQALEEKNLLADEEGSVAKQGAARRLPADQNRWWWDAEKFEVANVE
jgi:hypothetical protein